MAIKAILTGSTGMVGKGVLLECISDPRVEKILVINRQPVGIQHEKLQEIILPDIFDLSPVADALKGYDACFFCLGVSSAGMKEVQYTRITYDLTLSVARILLPLNPGMTFCYVSGAGTDSTESGNTMWARVKGKTENALLKLGFKDAYMFRPGLIRRARGVRSRTRLYNILYLVFAPVIPLLRLIPGMVTTSGEMGRAMIAVAITGSADKILESRDIIRLGRN